MANKAATNNSPLARPSIVPEKYHQQRTDRMTLKLAHAHTGYILPCDQTVNTQPAIPTRTKGPKLKARIEAIVGYWRRYKGYSTLFITTTTSLPTRTDRLGNLVERAPTTLMALSIY